MKPSAQDIYYLISDKRLKKVNDFFQEGITGMYVVLKILDDAHKELSAGDISEILEVSTARTAVALKTLEKKGLIKKSKSELDSRKTIVRITKDGLLVLNERKQKIIEAIEMYISNLSNEDIENLYNILQKLLNI